MTIIESMRWVEANCSDHKTVERLRSRRVALTLAVEVERLRSALEWISDAATDDAWQLRDKAREALDGK